MKTLKSQDVIGLLQQKIELKKTLRQAKKDGDKVLINKTSNKIVRIEDKLSQSHLQKS
jgi:hypothetical protein